jgi:dipeptidyl-peptidase-3
VKNPFTGEEITTFYTASETWGQKFGKLHSGYEECRADSVALYLIQFEEPFKIFCQGRDAEWDDIYYTCWLEMLYQGIRGLMYFDAENKVWGQAHIWAAWVIFQAVREGDDKLMQFEFSTKDDGKETFTLKIDRSRIREHGFKALSDFLHKLHVYKSIGDFETA